jgi:hypothetical protein
VGPTDDEDDERREPGEPPPYGPSTPPTLKFNPLATAIGVFTAIAIPAVVVGYTRPAGANGTIIAIGIGAGVVLGIVAGLWVAHRGGRVWRGPQL